MSMEMKKLEFASIQYLRGVAAMMVVVQHALAHVLFVANKNSIKIDLGGFNSIGNSGVDLFFVISGFVMASSTQKLIGGRVQAISFLRRRGNRILPMYWAFLTAYLLLSIVSDLLMPGAMEIEKNYSLSYIALSYFLIPAYNGDLIAPYLGVGWSLYFEVYFYCIVGLVLAIGARARTLWLISILSSTVLIGWLLRVDNPIGLVVSSPLVFEFLFGWLAFRIFCASEGYRLTRDTSLSMVVFGILIFCLSIFLYEYRGIYDWVRVLWWGIPSLMIIVGMIGLERCGVRFKSRHMLLLGAASYVLYLSHKAITLPILNKILGYGSFSTLYGIIWFFLLIAVSVVVGVLSHLYIEEPLQKRLARTA